MTQAPRRPLPPPDALTAYLAQTCARDRDILHSAYRYALQRQECMRAAKLAKRGKPYDADLISADGTLGGLVLLGEPCKYVPEHIKRAFPQMPWDNLATLRDELCHLNPASERFDSEAKAERIMALMPPDFFALAEILNEVDLAYPNCQEVTAVLAGMTHLLAAQSPGQARYLTEKTGQNYAYAAALNAADYNFMVIVEHLRDLSPLGQAYLLPRLELGDMKELTALRNPLAHWSKTNLDHAYVAKFSTATRSQLAPNLECMPERLQVLSGNGDNGPTPATYERRLTGKRLTGARRALVCRLVEYWEHLDHPGPGEPLRRRYHRPEQFCLLRIAEESDQAVSPHAFARALRGEIRQECQKHPGLLPAEFGQWVEEMCRQEETEAGAGPSRHGIEPAAVRASHARRQGGASRF